jgi:pyruvate dehydrogenase E2 component (dihydrolipoamide acetyltransferase)
VNLKQVTGSGPRGRVQAADVEDLAGGRGMAAQEASREAKPPGGVQVVPLAGMRRTVAERMTVSYQTTPHITLTMRVDMGAFEEARAQHNATGVAARGQHVSVTALIVKAVAWALRRHPWLNSTLRGVEDPAGHPAIPDPADRSGLRDRGKEIHLLPEVNVGVAVALEQGLIVPVLHAADRRSLMETAAVINDLTARAREGRLTPADVAGGTFTVTNLGVFGVEQFTAIINPPQAAILAVGALQPEAVVKGGQVVVRPMMRMTLSADHRIVDGAVAARFMSDLRDALESPVLLI